MIVSILANWSNTVLRLASVFLLYPFLVGTMGKEQYSLWLLIVAITGNFTLLRLGVPMATVRYMTEAHPRGDWQRVREVLGSSLAIYVCTGLLVALIGVVCVGLLDSVFNVPADQLPVARVAFLVTVASCAISFPFEVLQGTLNAFEKFVAYNLIQVFLVIAKLVLLFLFVTRDNGLEVMALVNGGEVLAQAIITYGFIRRTLPAVKFSLRYFRRAVLKDIFNYSLYTLVLHVASRVAFQTDAMVIGALLAPTAIVFFSVGNQFLSHLTTLIGGVSGVMIPRSSILHSTGEEGRLRELYMTATRLTVLLLVPACAAFFIIGDDFIGIWMGEEFKEPSGMVLKILAASYFPFLVHLAVGQSILLGISQVRVPTLAMTAAAALNLAMSIALAPILGINGVAWGTAIPNYLYAFAMMIYASRRMGVRPSEYFSKAVAFPALSGVFFVGPVLAWERLVRIDDYWAFGLVALTSSLVYVAGVYLFFLSKEQKEWISAKVWPRRMRSAS